MGKNVSDPQLLGERDGRKRPVMLAAHRRNPWQPADYFSLSDSLPWTGTENADRATSLGVDVVAAIYPLQRPSV